MSKKLNLFVPVMKRQKQFLLLLKISGPNKMRNEVITSYKKLFT